MKKLKITPDDFFITFEDQSGTQTGFLDRETGEVLLIMWEIMHEEMEEEADRIEEDRERYIRITPISPREGFRIMEEFVETLPDGEERRILDTVLRGAKPFRNFKEALFDMGDLREQWFEFHHPALLRLAEEFLSRWNIEPEWISYSEYLKLRGKA